MMSNEVLPPNLPLVENLFKGRNEEAKRLIGAVQLKEVKEAAAYDATLARIKKQVLLDPVIFEEPTLVPDSLRTETRNNSASFPYLLPGGRNVQVVTVRFKFNGSRELFNYAPNNGSFNFSDTLFQPSFGSTIDIAVELPQMDKDTALGLAKQRMKGTFAHFEQLNPQAIRWSESIAPDIDTLLQKRKEDLGNLFG